VIIAFAAFAGRRRIPGHEGNSEDTATMLFPAKDAET
jgi:hypothetical protein